MKYFMLKCIYRKSIENERTINVHGHLDENLQRLITGMFVEAAIVVDSKKRSSHSNRSLITKFCSVFKERKQHLFL
jgi:cobalt-zinc-cadmium efflux system membrane fusion protein